MPWSLTAPLSRMVVLPAPGGVVIAGGLSSAQTSTDGVYHLDTTTGSLQQTGVLAHAVHDASGGVVGGSGVVFGGGSTTTVASVQAFSSTPSPGAAQAGTSVSSLPTPRSDSAAVTVGATTYIIGGFDGNAATADVLATTDARTFVKVATLAVPVRYPAVAASGRYIYVFGGESVGGGNGGGAGGSPGSGSEPANSPVDVIQRVDPTSHTCVVVGHLPYPLEAAVAANIDGNIYVAGGDSPTGGARAPGMGSTQLNGWASAPGQATPGLTAIGDVWAFNTATGAIARAGELQVPVAHAGMAVQGGSAWIIGGESTASVVGTVQSLRPNQAFGTAGAPGAGSPYFGNDLLVADRGNNRLLLLDSSMRVLWTYPNSTSPPDTLGFYFPDDAFFADHGTMIVSNQEENDTIVEIAYPSGRIIWSYGHPKVAGTAPGYLHEPDDAYLLRNGQISVADAQNCRVLVLNSNGTVASQIGTDGRCVHNPPASMGSPNGDTPLWNGNLLVSEINGSWVSEYTPSGRLVWTAHLPIAYPSDPQQVGATPTSNPDRYLLADYTRPGEVLQFNREGQILSTYVAQAGPGLLDHPSLAEELPDGMYMINDDYNNRMIAIDPSDGAVIWQYGVTGQAGTGPGQLNLPDGFDLLGPGGTTPTHPQTG